jgi:hypothetical protein
MNVTEVFHRLPGRYQLEEFLLFLSLHPESWPQVLHEVMENDNPKAAFRALWACEKVSQRWPEWWTDEQCEQIRQLVMHSTHTGMLRLGISILNSLPPASETDVELINRLYELLMLASTPPGVQAQAMRLLYALVKDNYDLLNEFWLILDELADDFDSPAFRAARKNLLKRKR